MDKIQAIERAKRNINFNIKHPNYKRAVALKKIYLQIITGEAITDLIPRFEYREDANLYKQRLLLTFENLSSSTAPICDRFYGVARVQPSKAISAENSNKQKYILDAERQFWNRQDIDNYMDVVLDEIAMYDPNSFIAVTFDSFKEGDIPKIYPTIYGCDEVFDFSYNRDGSLDYLFIAEQVQVYGVDGKEKSIVVDYYMISEGNLIVFNEIHKDRQISASAISEVFEAQTGKKYNVSYFFIGSNKIKKNETPAKRLGYIFHKKYRSICVSPIHNVISILRDMIRDKSELDVSKRCGVFPQKLMYANDCEGESPQRMCNNGIIAGTNDQCTTCKGSGLRPHRSGQDVITFKMPKGKDEMFPLKDLVYYVAVDLETIKFLKQEIQDNQAKLERAIFASSNTNSSNLSATKENKTATQAIISSDEYNYVLDSWAKNRAEWYMFIVRIIGQAFDTVVNVSCKYNGKYVMESETELISRISLLVNAGLSGEVLDEAEFRLAKNIFDNDETALKRYMTKRTFNPFRGKSKDEIAQFLQSENVIQFAKVLYENSVWLFESIEREKGIEFYDLGTKEQFPIVEEEVNKIIDKLKIEAPTIVAGLPRNLNLKDNIQ